MTTPVVDGIQLRTDSKDKVQDRGRYAVPAVIAGVLLATVALGGLTNDAFLTSTNILAILRSAAITGIVALGATFITISGRFFSLALAQTAVFSSVIFALLLRAGIPFLLALLVTLLAAVALGCIQGAVVSMGANPIVTTLGAGALLAGLAGLLTDGKSIRISDAAASWIGNARPWGIPTQTLTFLLLIVVAALIMRRTRLGRATLLTGANRATAEACGIAVWRVTVAAFVLASAAAAVAGVFGAAQFEQARISEFSGLDFDVVAAVLIGGTAIQGGEGSPLRTALGAVFIAMVQNYMLLLRFPFGLRTLILGGLILLAVVAFHILRRRRGGAA